MNYDDFITALFQGNLQELDRLIGLKSYEIEYLIRVDDFELFRGMAYTGHLAVMEKFMAFLPDEVPDMVRAADYGAFREAARNGHLAVMEKLIEILPDEVPVMVRAAHYYAFREAARNGHLAVMEKLIEILPDEVPGMVRAANYGAFGVAACNGHLAVMEKLIEILPDEVPVMVRAGRYYAIREAAHNGHLAVIKRLLAFSEVFDYAGNSGYYQEHISGFIHGTIIALQEEIKTHHENHPSSVFDVQDTDKVRLYYFIVKNLIQKNTDESKQQLKLLLSIPSVIAIAHQEVTPNQPNGLVSLAMLHKNFEAASLLLEIPAVHQLAAENNFYLRQERSCYVRLSAEVLISFFKALPQSISSVSIDGEKYMPPGAYLLNFPQSQLETLWKDYVTPLEDENNHILTFKTIQPVMLIDEKILHQIIEMFEKNPSPSSDIACALLLEGRIENGLSMEEPSQDYKTSRRLYALDFLRRAACNSDKKLAKTIEEISSHIKAIEPEESPIHNKLSQFLFSQELDFQESTLGNTPFIIDAQMLPPIDINSLLRLLSHESLIQHSLFSQGQASASSQEDELNKPLWSSKSMKSP